MFRARNGHSVGCELYLCSSSASCFTKNIFVWTSQILAQKESCVGSKGSNSASLTSAVWSDLPWPEWERKCGKQKVHLSTLCNKTDYMDAMNERKIFNNLIILNQNKLGYINKNWNVTYSEKKIIGNKEFRNSLPFEYLCSSTFHTTSRWLMMRSAVTSSWWKPHSGNCFPVIWLKKLISFAY